MSESCWEQHWVVTFPKDTTCQRNLSHSVRLDTAVTAQQYFPPCFRTNYQQPDIRVLIVHPDPFLTHTPQIPSSQLSGWKDGLIVTYHMNFMFFFLDTLKNFPKDVKVESGLIWHVYVNCDWLEIRFVCFVFFTVCILQFFYFSLFLDSSNITHLYRSFNLPYHCVLSLVHFYLILKTSVNMKLL